MDCYGVYAMEEDTGSRSNRKGLSPPLITSQANSFGVGNSNVGDGRDVAHVRLDGATSALSESEPLLSVTRRLKEKREGAIRD